MRPEPRLFLSPLEALWQEKQALDNRTVQSLPPDIEEHRDRCWRRDESLRVDTVEDAERFIDQVGFAACLTDARRPGPSLYVAVCGRRDAVMPRNVQKDQEASLTWMLKDEIVRRGQGLLREAGARQGDVHRAAHDPVLSRRLGHAPIRGRAASQPDARAILSVLRARVGDGHRRTCATSPA